jgi:formate dehydrogenase (NADP+) beta subunit
MSENTPKLHPVYVDRLPPCNHNCPAGQNIQKWLSFAKKKLYRQAWETIMLDNPIPATIGRVCYHPCEHSCNRYGFDNSVNINATERFLGDMALHEHWAIKKNQAKSGKKVMVIGAGPAGLSCAYHLCMLGHEVTIYEKNSFGGGMTHIGIPTYRLPRSVIDNEVKRVESIGVSFEYNHYVEDVIAKRDHGKFNATFIATGAQTGKEVEIPTTGSNCNIIDAIKFLGDIEFGNTPKIAGHNVIVYGGGNTAIDAARAAIRLGAETVEIVYRRNREKMPAYDFEIAEASDEGVNLHLLRTVKKLDNRDVTLDIMELNTEGWPIPTGNIEIIQADTIILALGLNPNTQFLRKIEGLSFKSDDCLVVNDHLMTGIDGIFAGGDMIPGERSVTTAIGHGKKAARNIDAYLNGKMFVSPTKHELAGHDKLHINYYQKADRKERNQVGFPERKETFDEVVLGLAENEVNHETQRCFSCGNCFECDTCFKICPVKAISKLGVGKGYNIDYQKCIRCGLCVKKCPCGAMKMIEDK